ncbi:MAG: hypothetical protein ACI89J_002473 [Hyphomicrobiaceae bacterium]|jgi:hypothetical protein
MRTVDLIAGIGLLSFVAMMVFVIIPAENSEGIWHGLSPYFYPTLMLVGIAASSLGLVLQTAFKKQLYQDQPNSISRWQIGCFLLLGIVIFVCVLVIDWAGLWVGGPLLIAATMVFMGERNPLVIVPTGFVTVAVVHVIVTYGLKIPLP